MKILFTCSIVILLLSGCRERYEVPYRQADTGYLIVEGNIIGNDSTIVRLSRSVLLGDRKFKPELNAEVSIQGEDGSSFRLLSFDSGYYKCGPVQLDDATRYRLHILTADKREYASAYRQKVSSPAIDSITWKRNNGVQIFVNSKGSSNDTRYFKWDYEEVWEFHSVAESRAFFTYEMMPSGEKKYVCVDVQRGDKFFNTCIDVWNPPPTGTRRNDSMYRCWQSRNSIEILTGTTEHLSENILYVPVRIHPENSWELNELYSIVIRQTGLSKDGYDFYHRLKKNTESLGSVFDALPGELNSNIANLSDPGEQVVGFVDITNTSSKRIFISKQELPGWNYVLPFDCPRIIGYNNPDSITSYVNNSLVPAEVLEMTEYRIDSVMLRPLQCMDCRLRGYHAKPQFWPN